MLAFLTRTSACATAAILAAMLPAFAQSEPSPQPAEIGRVTTSDRQDEPISRTSRPTFIVDRRAIEASGARTIADALRNLPGFQEFRYGPFGAQSNYGVLGATSEQTLVLLDGVPIAAASSGSVDLGSFSTAGVERIEVVESAGSTLYGSSAMGGIINIITGHAPPRPHLALSAGSLGDRAARFEAGSHGVDVVFERHIASNVYDYPSSSGFPAGTRTNTDAMSTTGRIAYRGSLGPSYAIDGALGIDAVTIGVPGGLSFLTPNARQSTSRSSGHLTLSRHGERSALSLTLSGSHQALAYNDPDNGGESDTYDARTQLSLRNVVGDDRSSLIAGLDLGRQTALLYLGASSTPPSATASMAQSAIYAQYSRALTPQLRVTLGLRGEHDVPQGSVALPSLGVVAQLGSVRLAANYAGSFRVPTIDDLYFPGFSNPKLLPERAKNLDATLSAPAGRGTVSLEWFNRSAVNLIELDSNFVPQNLARASIGGFVFSGRTAPFEGITATLGVTNLYRALDLTPGTSQSRLTFEPVFTVDAGLEKPIETGNRGFGFGVKARVAGQHVEAGILRNGETVVDAYVSARIAARTIATLRSHNLGNERYMPILGYPAPGRTLEIEFSQR